MSELEAEIVAGTISLDSIPDSLDSKDEVAAKLKAKRLKLAVQSAATLIGDYHREIGDSLSLSITVHRSNIPREVIPEMITAARLKGWDVKNDGSGHFRICPNYDPEFRQSQTDKS